MAKRQLTIADMFAASKKCMCQLIINHTSKTLQNSFYSCSARNVAPAPRVNQEYDSLRNQTLLHAQGIHLNTKELIRHIETVKVHI